MFDIISVGPSGIDTVVDVHDAEVHCSLNKENCEICFRFADKIIADGLVTKTAYNAMNNAVGSSRLGLKTAFYTVVGGDDHGDRIKAALKQEKVNAKYIQTEKKLRSNAAVVINFKGERTILVYHEVYKYKLPKFDKTKWYYLTSMGKNWQPFYLKFAKRVKRTGESLGFNPGSYQLKAGPYKLKPIFKITKALFLNREEARLMTKIKKEKNIMELLKGMRKLGAAIAVCTDGPKGSYTFDGHKALYQETFEPTPVIERTGCGDSYATGFMAALIYGRGIDDAMRWGTINAAGVLRHIGPQDGLMKISQIRKLARERPKFGPTPL